MARVLYISYDGLLEPLGQSQVWQYVRRLGAQHQITLLTFEKAEDLGDVERRDRMRSECSFAGVRWIALRYHRRPSAPATAFDVAVGSLVASWVALRESIEVVHARSYVPSVIALFVKALFPVRFVFDMRGFWADERVDGGLWPAGGALYRMAKRFERAFLSRADRIVSLTLAGVQALRRAPFPERPSDIYEVITTCTDLTTFAPTQVRDASTPFTLGYVGSVGVWYLFDEVAKAFVALQRVEPAARLLVVNRGGHDLVRRACADAGVDMRDVEIVSAEPREVPKLINRMDAGVFFYKPAPSRTGTAPTRLGEFLATGLPVWINAGVGDMDEIVQNGDHPLGVIVDRFEGTRLERAASQLIALAREPSTRLRCRKVAEERFSADLATAHYSRVYEELAR